MVALSAGIFEMTPMDLSLLELRIAAELACRPSPFIRAGFLLPVLPAVQRFVCGHCGARVLPLPVGNVVTCDGCGRRWPWRAVKGAIG